MIRRAELKDVPVMVELSEQRRIRYDKELAPRYTYFRKAHDSREKQTPYLEGLLLRDDHLILVHERDGQLTGFIDGGLYSPPPVYDPGGRSCIVDDFVVATPEDWETVGASLLEEVITWARQQGAVHIATVCTPIDPLKRRMLSSSGLGTILEFFCRNI
jgi:GNAT superfamily N-acetyltransferase